MLSISKTISEALILSTRSTRYHLYVDMKNNRMAVPSKIRATSLLVLFGLVCLCVKGGGGVWWCLL